MQSACRCNLRHKFVQIVGVALSSDADHWNAARMVGSSREPMDILRDDVLEQRCFAGTALADEECLHRSNMVRPQPWLFVDVITQHNRVQSGSNLDRLPILEHRDDNWRVWPAFLDSTISSGEKPERGEGGAGCNNQQYAQSYHLPPAKVKCANGGPCQCGQSRGG